MKRYIRSTIELQVNLDDLHPIQVDKHWIYLPRDNSEVFENPITYAGDEVAREVVRALYGWDYDIVSEEIESVDLDYLESVQAFVTKDGLLQSHTDSEDKKPYAVRLEDNLYLMDGNHRVARAFLNGVNKYRMKVITLEKV